MFALFGHSVTYKLFDFILLVHALPTNLQMPKHVIALIFIINIDHTILNDACQLPFHEVLVLF